MALVGEEGTTGQEANNAPTNLNTSHSLILVKMSCNVHHQQAPNPTGKPKMAQVIIDCRRKERWKHACAELVYQRKAYTASSKRPYRRAFPRQGPSLQNVSRTKCEQINPDYEPLESNCGSFRNQRPKRIKSQQANADKPMMLHVCCTSARHGVVDSELVRLHIGDTGQIQLSEDFATINDQV